MTATLGSQVTQTHRVAAIGLYGARHYAMPATWPVVLVFILALLQQIHGHLIDDVSWLITAGEEILGGKTAYVDFLEVNPPAAFLIYLPATLAARLLGATPEFMTVVFCFLSVGASLALCGLVLRQAGLAPNIGPTSLAAAAAVLALLPANAFAEREHIALVAGLPLFVALAARARAAQIGLGLRMAAGLGAGLMVSLKPHLALMIIVPLPYFIWRAGFRAMISSVEFWAAGAVCAVYAAATVLFFPAYFERIVPLAFAVYTPLRYSWSAMIGGTAFEVWLVLGVYLIVVARRRLTDPLIATTALASTGGILAYFIQGKGWAYQSYPAIALMAIALIAASSLENAPRRRLWTAVAFSGLVVVASNFASPQIISVVALMIASLGVVALILGRLSRGVFLRGWSAEFSAWMFASIAATAWLWFDHTIPPFTFEAQAAALTPHPKVAAITNDLSAFPFLRRIGGVWVQRANCLWVTSGAQTRIAQSGGDPSIVAQMQPYLKLDRDMLVEDIERNKPDIILVSNRLYKLRDWAFTERKVAAALADYRLYASDQQPGGETFLYARADLLALRSAPAN